MQRTEAAAPHAPSPEPESSEPVGTPAIFGRSEPPSASLPSRKELVERAQISLHALGPVELSSNAEAERAADFALSEFAAAVEPLRKELAWRENRCAARGWAGREWERRASDYRAKLGAVNMENDRLRAALSRAQRGETEADHFRGAAQMVSGAPPDAFDEVARKWLDASEQGTYPSGLRVSLAALLRSRFGPLLKDKARLDYLENEALTEEAWRNAREAGDPSECPDSLFRRNLPITREAIDAARSSGAGRE